MSIVQDEKELEYWSDQKLLEEAQTPTGRMPLFLIHTQIEKRKNYRASANARKETPATTVYEEDVAEFGGGGLGSMQQQMPMSPPPNQQMPPPQQMLPPQQMPMSAGPPQAGMGVAPMARGGLIRAQDGVHLPKKDLSAIGGGYRGTGRGNLTRKQIEELEKKIRSYKSNLKLSPFENARNARSMSGGGLIRAQTGRRLPMANEASQVAAQGRYGDSTLVHMNPIEVAAMNRNGDLTVNPKTGLPEAWAPLVPLLMGGARAGLGALGRSGAARSLAGMRARLPTWMGGPKGRVTPRGPGTPYGSLPNPRQAPVPRSSKLPYNPPALRPMPAVVPKGGPGGPGGLGGFWGSKYGPKAYPKTWGIGIPSGLYGLYAGLSGGEDELTDGGGGGPSSPDAGTVQTSGPSITDLSKKLYGTFLQPEEGYEKELTKAESYRRTPAQRKAEAQGIAFSGLAKALSNVGMADIISGVADVTPDVMALRKYQTEEERVVDKNVADLTRTRRGDKATAMQAAIEWEKVKNLKSSYEQRGELDIHDAAMKAYGAQMSPYGVPGHIPFDTFIHYYRTGEWLGPGGGSAQGDFDEAGLTETE